MQPKVVAIRLADYTGDRTGGTVVHCANCNEQCLVARTTLISGLSVWCKQCVQAHLNVRVVGLLPGADKEKADIIRRNVSRN